MYRKVNGWFNTTALEERILDFWRENRIFKKLLEKNKNGEKWSFLDGPITANNPMGIHHAWGRALKDAFQRFRAMTGRKLRYQNGFDCQGLWVEVEVEKEMALSSKKDIEKRGIDVFVTACKDRVRKYADIITEQSIRLGYWMDWDNSYYTMSDENNYTIWTFLKKCHEKKLIYKGHDVMPWCPRCGTGISQHEMQDGYHDTHHQSLIVEMEIRKRPDEYFLVWTTTPWTLTSNVALAVNPSITYVKVEQSGKTFYLARNRTDAVLSEKGSWNIIEELSGKQLLEMDMHYQGPFDEFEAQIKAGCHHRVVGWGEVIEAEGTGIVHIAPGCGTEDFMLAKDCDLHAISPIDESGMFIDGFGWLSGKAASKAASEIEKNLANKKILYSSDRYRHSYPHCWRCDHELLFRLVDEWFIRMDPWREEIIKITKKIEWIPSFGKNLELDWLSNMHDWMISKKRYWGLALPIWECADCRYFEVIGSFEELKERAVEGWEAFDGNSPHKPWIDEIKLRCPNCGKLIGRIPDVGNPWLDAGIVPYSTVKYNTDRDYWKDWIPADFVLECFPGQFRNWFYSLLSMSTMMDNIPPFKILLGHASVRDEKGEEMHKSKGNAIWLDDAVEKAGADIIRWLFFGHDIAANINFSYKTTKQLRGKFFNTLWNCYSFYINYASLTRFVPSSPFSKVIVRNDFDRWILSKLQLLIEKCRQGLESYDIRSVCRSAEEFIDDLSNWYIRLNRRRFWKVKSNEETFYEFETLFECLITLIELLAPLIPFLTEEMYQNMVRSWDGKAPESIHLHEYPMPDPGKMDVKLVKEMDTIKDITGAALNARQKAGIKTRQPLSKLTIYPSKSEDTCAIDLFRDTLLKDLNVKKIEIATSGKPDFRQSAAPYRDGWVSLDTFLNEELIDEGLLREFLRKSQVLRKKSGFEIEDRIHITYRTTSSRLKGVFGKYHAIIRDELLCLELKESLQLEEGSIVRVEKEEVLLDLRKNLSR